MLGEAVNDGKEDIDSHANEFQEVIDGLVAKDSTGQWNAKAPCSPIDGVSPMPNRHEPENTTLVG